MFHISQPLNCCARRQSLSHPEEVPRRYKVGRHRIVHNLDLVFGGNFGYAYSSSHSRSPSFTTPYDHLISSSNVSLINRMTRLACSFATGTTLGEDKRCSSERNRTLSPRCACATSIRFRTAPPRLACGLVGVGGSACHSLHSRDRRSCVNVAGSGLQQ